MGCVKVLTKDTLEQPTVYLFEGGMVREHRTVNSLQLAYKMRLASLFTSHILIQASNLLEEESIFEALQHNQALVSAGKIMPVMWGSSRTIEEYADNWRNEWENQLPSRKFLFYQAKKISNSKLKILLERADYFDKHPYMLMGLESPDNVGAKARFVTSVDKILNAETELSDKTKVAIMEHAENRSPLGRIRTEVIDKVGYKGNELMQRIARRINLAFFAAGCTELSSWLSLSNRAYSDLSHSTDQYEAYIADLLEFALPKALYLPDPSLVLEVPSEEFTDIVTSRQAGIFRREVQNIISELDLSEPVRIQGGQEAVYEAFRDHFYKEFDKAFKKRKADERRRLKGLMVPIKIISVVAGVVINFPLLSGIPGSIAEAVLDESIEEGTGAALSKLAKSTSAPILFFQDSLDKAFRRAR